MGLPVVIENPTGSTRQWHDREAKVSGETVMQHDYGFIDGHVGVDGDEIDCYLGPNEAAQFVYVVHQQKAPEFKSFDEDKVMLGFTSEQEAKAAYLAHRSDGEKAYGGMSVIPTEAFIKKLSRRTGTGKVRHEARQKEAVIMPSRKRVLFAGPLGKNLALFNIQRGADGRVRANVWDRVCVPGFDEKDGQSTEFTVETCSQFVDNFVERGDVIPLDHNHQSNYASTNGMPAPALAFYGALAVVWGGKIVKAGNANGVEASGTDGIDPSKDGLYAYRSEVTELGQELLPNFKLLSPTFSPQGTKRDGTECGYSLYAIAATNTPHQAGTFITFEMASTDGLKKRIATALGWSESDVNSVSLASLRDLVRPVSASLAEEISRVIQSGSYLMEGDVAMSAYGVCPNCGLQVQVTSAGELTSHGDAGHRCPGSGQAPKQNAPGGQASPPGQGRFPGMSVEMESPLPGSKFLLNDGSKVTVVDVYRRGPSDPTVVYIVKDDSSGRESKITGGDVKQRLMAVEMGLDYEPAGKAIGGGKLTHVKRGGQVVGTINQLYPDLFVTRNSATGREETHHSESEAKAHAEKYFSNAAVSGDTTKEKQMAGKLAKFAAFVGMDGEKADDAAIKQALLSKMDETAMASACEDKFDYEGESKKFEDMAKAYEDAHMDAEDGDEPPHFAMRKMAAKFRKLAKMAEPQAEEPGNQEGEMAKHEEPVKQEEDAKMATMEAAFRALSDKVAKFEQIEATREAAEKKEQEQKYVRLADLAEQGGYPKDSRESLIKFARIDFEGARKSVAPFLPKGGAPAHLFDRISSMGAPLGKHLEARDEHISDKPTETQAMGRTFIAEDERYADEIKKVAESLDPVTMAKVDKYLPVKHRPVLFNRLMAAEKVVAKERPELVRK